MQWKIEIKHDGLNKFKVIRGDNKFLVEREAQQQMRDWDEEWLHSKKRKVLIKSREAEEKTSNAKEEIKNIKQFLMDSFIFPSTTWEDGIEHSDYSEPEPKPPEIKFHRKKPVEADFPPRMGLFGRKDPKKVEARKKIAKEKYEKALQEYNNELFNDETIKQKYETDLRDWKVNKEKFYQDQENKNQIIAQNKLDYENNDISTVRNLANIILDKSKNKYINNFPKSFSTEFNLENKVLVVDFKLPTIESIPKLKEIKYNQSKDEFTEIYISDSEIKALYDNFLYQIVLARIHELYRNDYKELIDPIVFNGWVDTVDRGTGKDITLCILSVQTSREEFMSFDLKKVDPKECFRKLKGVGSPRLHTITPIAPILKIEKTDKRFIDSYEVIGELDDSENLALMDWEDFEHLIREIFEKEFSTNGGEVKVTQSSRDGGVDAIAFDPDPIRGGKIVIQAKRYTNTVGVAAVRDLFGTVQHEGAIKGIIVTTSNYGADAYRFAKDKPLTLLNGANLLHLLEKHSRKAKIDLKEARKILDQKK